MNEGTWTCHVCGRERPDERISVFKSDRSAAFGLPPGSVGQNVRYCNDRVTCLRDAPKVDFLRKVSA